LSEAATKPRRIAAGPRRKPAPPRQPPLVLIFASYFDNPDGTIISPDYEDPAYRADVAEWMAGIGVRHEWVRLSLKTLEARFAEVEARCRTEDVVVLNLCDGTEVTDGFVGISAVKGLEARGIPYTGADRDFYEATTSKVVTKTRLMNAGVATGPWVLIEDIERDLARVERELKFPVMVKPDISAGSLGIQVDSRATSIAAVRTKVNQLIGGLHEEMRQLGTIFVEPFIEGREFTVLVVEDPAEPLGIWVLPPGERVFDQRVPPRERFLAYERYWCLPEENPTLPEGEPYYWYDSAPPDLRPRIEDLSRRAFRAAGGRGYARMDIRYDQAADKFFVIDVNSNCGLSSDASSSVGSMLNLAGLKMVDVIRRIVEHARNDAAAPAKLKRAAR